MSSTVSAVTTKKVAVIPLEISGWIPYWRTATGTAEAINHISVFKELSPFGYTVKLDGTLYDPMNIGQEPWTTLIQTAKANKVKIIPTVMWSNADNIYATLKSPTKRKAHIQAIVTMVKSNNFDGVDIDYEGKSAETKKYFSLFLKELWNSIGNKIVSCTIEARTPLDSRFVMIPKDIQYANDYVEINKYCDRVRIMTYDQGTVDLKLNALSSGPYVPVSDPKWVEKVITLASKTISKKKITIGVATYGYEYTVTPVQGGYVYDRETSFNPNYALSIASAFGVASSRSVAGELNLIYTPTSTPLVTTSTTLATTTPSLDTSLFGQSAVTSSSGGATTSPQVSAPFRLLVWSDAQAVKDKIALAKKLGVRGISIFKIDGGADPAIWNVLK